MRRQGGVLPEIKGAAKNIIKAKKLPSTQEFLEIEEIHNGVTILKNGTMKVVLLVSTVNFALKSEDEQNAIVFAYQNFLNSLPFPLQIVMQSRRIDLSGYLAKLRDEERKQANELIRLQTSDYIAFIERLVSVANIMSKKFFVIINFEPVGQKKETILDKISRFVLGKNVKREIKEFEKNKRELTQRAEVVAQGLGAMGLRAVQLNTEELAELFYSTYNPEIASRQKIFNLGEVETPYVGKGK